MLDWWQTFPSHIDPVVFSVGFFSIYWYGLLLAAGIGIAAFLLWALRRRGELPLSASAGESLFLWALIGAFIGGKLGYIFWYAGEEFLRDPGLFGPWQGGGWQGLAGMSYHGALLGSLFALAWWSRRCTGQAADRRRLFGQALDVVALLAPVLTFFGRIGNFLVGELPGRLTTAAWGVIYPGLPPAGALRHPSALYEALGEGLVLGILVWSLRHRRTRPGDLFLIYLGSYSLLRFVLEFFREPDPNRGLYWGVLSLGQILSLLFLAAVLVFSRRPKRGIL